MSDIVTLQQGDPVIILNDTVVPTIIHSAEIEEVVIATAGAVFETTNINAPVTYETHVTQIVEPGDPGDLTLIFENHLI
jgi:hypothetical protein